MASNEPALIPTPEQLRGHAYDADGHSGYTEWDTAEWNITVGWTPPVTEQAPPIKGAVDGWDTAEWNMRAVWADMAQQAEPQHQSQAGHQSQPGHQPQPGTGPAANADVRSAATSRSEADSWFGTTPPRAAQAERVAEAEERRGPNRAADWVSDAEQGSGTAGAAGLAATEAGESWFGDEPGALRAPDTSWNPTSDSVAPVRGRHRVAKQRTLGRGSAVFGVAAAAVLGVGGVASAEGHNPLSVSLPDLPEVSDMPGIGTLVATVTGSDSGTHAASDTAPFKVDAGEALRTRIIDQANQQRSAATQAKRDAAAAKAAKEAAAKKVREDAAAKKKATEEAARKKAAEEAARLAKSYVKPVSSYTLTASFGQSSSLWANTHTGQDFAAPTGTPVVAIHGGTITSAGWAGSYGYRIILTLDDGTEIWYAHLSSMTVTSGKVNTGETIGRVGATGNVTGPHLHLEVRPNGGSPIDPMPWLRARGLSV